MSKLATVDPRTQRAIVLSPAEFLPRLAACCSLAAAAAAQTPIETSISIDYRGPTNAAFFEGDVLTPSPTLFPPDQVPGLPAPPLMLAIPASVWKSPCAHAPGDRGCTELDALSYGTDVEVLEIVDPQPFAAGTLHHRLWFSVDEFAVGDASNPCSPWSAVNVASEGDGGAREASADLFIDLRLPSAPSYPPAPCLMCPPSACPAPPPCATGGGGGVDGDGHFSATCVRYAGLDLVEPNPSSACPCSAWPCSTCAALGDDVDALDIDGPIGDVLYFSLDAAFLDPLLQRPNTGSAQALNALFGGAEVLRVDVNVGVVGQFAFTSQLGLDLIGPDPKLGSDDLDALILRDHSTQSADPSAHDGIFQPSRRPYDWALTNPLLRKDMLLFSVRRGSRVIGQTDSLLGLPIEPGDVLTTPLSVNWNPPSGCSYMPLSPYPAILIPAEELGLETDRANGILGDEYGDDLDALDTALVFLDRNQNGSEDVYDVLDGISFDCNRNGQPDEYDVAGGGSPDSNANQVPDECEPLPGTYCTPGTSANGCVVTISREDVPSASETSCFTLRVSNVDGQRQGLLFYGTTPIASPWGTFSFLCVATPVRSPIQNSGGNAGACDGQLVLDWNAFHASLGFPNTSGQPLYAQGWFRDPAVPKASCLSDGVTFTLGP